MHRNIIVRLATYYVVIIALLGAAFYAFPVLRQYQATERARQGVRASLEFDKAQAAAQAAAEAAAGPVQWLEPERSVPIVLSLVAALLVALPVSWVYRWTRPRRRYNQTFAQTLIVVPIAITLVVFLVKDSLALAFSLAGIVAAVRFRTTLDEPLDAVYLFLVIGTGLAAGVQLLFVALIASMLFNCVTLTVWRLNIGAQPAVLDGWRLVEAGPEAPIPGASAMAMRPDAAGGAEEPAEPYNAQLRLYVTQVEAAQRFASAFLDEHAKKWRMAEVATEADGTSVIEFDLRLKKSVDLAGFIKGIEQGDPHVAKVELMRTKKKTAEE
jgi:hypothetical protein